MATPFSPIHELFSISTARERYFKKLDIQTVSDLAYHFPVRYENRGDITEICDLVPGQTACIIAEVSTPVISRRIPKRPGSVAMSIQRCTVSDGTGTASLTFFNQIYIGSNLTVGKKLRIFGKVSETSPFIEFVSPDCETVFESRPLDNYLPVYPLTAGISRKLMTNALRQCVNIYNEKNYDNLPQNIISSFNLCSLGEAMRMIHFPSSENDVSVARRRFAFEELLDFQVRLLRIGEKRKRSLSHCITLPDMNEFYKKLSFDLTNAQKRAISDILSDMCKPSDAPVPMRRLVQGDVGCGKTLVAAAAVFAAANSGLQSAMMAPTEILAEQHFKSLYDLFESLGIKSALLTGSTKASQRKTILKLLANKEIDFIVGTHALIEDTVNFASLGLVITDEQHRFGVKQREKLSSKESLEDEIPRKPHMLVMSATPIPRTLAMMLYGDLDISIIDELPPGRQQVETLAVGEEYRERLDNFILKHAQAGNQIYVVCPLIEKNDNPEVGISPKSEAESVSEYAERLKSVFPDLQIEILHGKMKPVDKEAIMKRFASGEIKVLVSTTVVEVGVNVPNATLMIVENAEHFGLSQLHQLRGRVGRGKDKSYCVLVSPVLTRNPLKTNPSQAAKRLRVICSSNDGFKIAQSDLEIRGPGEFFGSRQSGEFRFKVADIAADMELVETTRSLAKKIVAQGLSYKD